MGPVPLLVGCLVVGVVAGRWLDPPWWITAVPGAASLVAGALLTRKRNRASWWLLLLASLLLGGFLGRRAGRGGPPGALPALPGKIVLEGRALGDEVVRDGGGRFLLRLTGARTQAPDREAGAWMDSSRRVRVVVQEGTTGVLEGDRVWIRSPRLIARRGHRNPGVEQGVGRPAGTVVVATRPGNVLVSASGIGPLPRLRSLLAARQGEMLSPAVAGFAEAVTTGRAEAAHPAVRDAFRRSGTAHLLAVSGLHLAMVAWVVFGLSRRLVSRISRIAERLPAQHVAAAVALGAAWAFALFASGRPPVLRAALMVSVATLARLSGRLSSPAASLSLAAGVLLVSDPSLLFSPSFVLSFSAVAGIFLASPRIRDAIEQRIPGSNRSVRALARGLASTSSVALAASMATLPAVAFFFGNVPVIGPLANVAAVPLFSLLFLPAALVHAVLCLTVPHAAAVLAPCVEAAAYPVLLLVSLVSRVPPVEVSGRLALAAAMCAAGALWLLVARRRGAAGLLAALSVALALVPGPIRHLLREMRLDGALTVVFLDVGQGDATYIRTPGGEHILVDAGPAHPGRGRDAPLPAFLSGWGVDRVHRVFISHPHADHFGGLADLVRESTRVEQVVLGVPESDPGADPGFHDLLRRLRLSGTRVLDPPPCGQMQVPGWSVIHPCGDEPSDVSIDVNDRSLVMSVCNGVHCFLMTGDIGQDVEAGVASRIDFACQVLKVPHHGSRGSSSEALLSLAGLRWAVVSARSGNRHGLPHPEPLDRLRGAGLAIHRVDLEGALVAVSDGSTIRFHDYRGREKWHDPCLPPCP